MQKTAPNIDTRLPGTGPPMAPGACPSAEELAAYIDGNLGKAESRRVTEHLASCEDCYAVYMGALQFQLDSSPAEPEGVVDGELVRFPSSEERTRAATRPPAFVVVSAARRWLPVAALLLVGVGAGTGTYLRLLAPPPGLVTTRLTPSAPGTEQLWLGPTYRGEGGGEEAKLDEAAFRMVVQLVNLQTTLQAGQGSESRDVIARILGLLKAQSFTDDLQKGYTGITVALTNYLENHKVTGYDLPEAVRLAKESHENQKAANTVLPEVSRLANKSRDAFDTDPLDLGQWVEAGRLAALSQTPSFFRQPETRSFLRHLLWRDKLGIGATRLDPATRESLEQVSEILSRNDLRASDYAELGQQLEKILDKYYPES
jgi:hypothetical protein